MKVIIDGVEYCPKCEIQPLNDEILKKALELITTMRYLNESHKMMPHTWELLEILAPELNKLTVEEAFDKFHETEE